MQIFATKASSRQERSRQWLAFTGADHVEIDDDREASIRGSLFGQVRLYHLSMGRHRVVQETATHGLAENPALKFFFQEEGTAQLRQGGRVIEIGVGQWGALRKDLPHAIAAPEHARQLTVTLPCKLIASPRPGFAWWGRPRSYLSGAAQILHATARAAIMAGNDLPEHDGEVIGRQLVELLAMTLRGADPAPQPNFREHRRQAALQFIDRHLADPGLHVGAIAHALGCSTRTIHKLFEGEAHTVARAIWDRRLDRCRNDLIDPVLASRSITQIAHFWGFSDSQHFSRAFKNRFGSTPREYRMTALFH